MEANVRDWLYKPENHVYNDMCFRLIQFFSCSIIGYLFDFAALNVI